MERSRIVLAAGMLGATVAAMAVTASAEPWGHDKWGTKMGT